MSEQEPIFGPGPDRGSPVAPESAQARTRRRLRRFFLRHVPLSLAALTILLIITVVGLFFWASSARGEAAMRERLVAWLEQATGGRVEIATFHWHLLTLEADAGGLVIHGFEAPGDAPYAQAENLRVRMSVLGFLSPRILLREADVVQPTFHLIVYVDGTTNQPHPGKREKQKKSALDTFFDLKAGRVSVEQGMLHYENRAANFDLQNRWIPLDFEADDVSLVMSYMPAVASAPEFYHIEAGAADLNMSRGKAKPMNGMMRAVLDLSRNAAYLRSLSITSRAPSTVSRFRHSTTEEHTVELSGTVQDFTRPHWQAKANGEFDMKIMDPVFGFPFTPQGISRLDLDAVGQEGEFRVDGSVHIDDGAYIAPGIHVTGVEADTRVHADPRRLIVDVVAARLRQGGSVVGELQLSPWLAPVPGSATLEKPGGVHTAQSASASKLDPAVHPPPPFIPFNGKVNARFNDVALDTVLDIFVQGPFQRLGLDTRLNGTGTASWSGGDVNTLSIGGTASLHPSPDGVKDEAPVTGFLDATYTQRNGAVDLRKLEVSTPASQLAAQGHLGAFPINSPTALSVEFHSHNLDEFDTILRDLGLNLNGKSGTSALPAALTGEVDFLNGTWNGSLVDPHLAGNAKATQLSIEMPVMQSGTASASSKNEALQLQFVHFDSVEAAGSYSAQRISIDRGVLRRGKSEINLSGTLDATSARGHAPAFDQSSVLHARLRANKVGLDDVQALAGQSVTTTGTIDTQLDADGPIRALGGSGWVELDGVKLYGEPVTRLRAQGTMANSVINFASINASAPAGSISATGSYDLKSRHFQIDAKGAGIDVAKIESGAKSRDRQQRQARGLRRGSQEPRRPAPGSPRNAQPTGPGGRTLGALVLWLTPLTARRPTTQQHGWRALESNLNGETALTGDICHPGEARILATSTSAAC